MKFASLLLLILAITANIQAQHQSGYQNNQNNNGGNSYKIPPPPPPHKYPSKTPSVPTPYYSPITPSEPTPYYPPSPPSEPTPYYPPSPPSEPTPYYPPSEPTPYYPPSEPTPTSQLTPYYSPMTPSEPTPTPPTPPHYSPYYSAETPKIPTPSPPTPKPTPPKNTPPSPPHFSPYYSPETPKVPTPSPPTPSPPTPRPPKGTPPSPPHYSPYFSPETPKPSSPYYSPKSPKTPTPPPKPSPPTPRPPKGTPPSPPHYSPYFSPETPKPSSPYYSPKSPKTPTPPPTPPKKTPYYSPKTPSPPTPYYSPKTPSPPTPYYSPVTPKTPSPPTPYYSPVSPKTPTPPPHKPTPPSPPRASPYYSPETPKIPSPPTPPKGTPPSPPKPSPYYSPETPRPPKSSPPSKPTPYYSPKTPKLTPGDRNIQKCSDNLGALMDEYGNTLMDNSCHPFLKNNDQRFRFKVNFLDPYKFDDECLDLEVVFEDTILEEGKAELDKWHFNASTQTISWNIRLDDFVDVYQCEWIADEYQFTWICEFKVNIYFHGHVQQCYSSKLQVTLDRLYENDLIVNVQKNEVIGECCENKLNIETQLRFCTDINCNQFKPSPLTVVRKQEFFVEFRIATSGYKDFHLSLLQVTLGDFYPVIVKQIIHPGRIILALRSNISKPKLWLSVIAQLHKPKYRVLQEIDQDIEVEDVGDDYKLKGEEQITILNPNELHQQEQETLKKKSVGDKKSVETMDKKLVIGAVVVGTVLVSVIGSVLIFFYLRKRKANKEQEDSNPIKNDISIQEASKLDHSSLDHSKVVV